MTGMAIGPADAAHGPRRERVSACMIVQDEQHNMPGALDSLSFCDEIVVVDGGSSDHTVAIAREHGATVIESPWPGFAAQRNVALDAATGEWVIELDADERVTPRLRASIELLLASPSDGVAMAVCPLRHRFLGRLLGPSAKYPAYRSRVFRREAYRHDESRAVHEGLEPRERPAVLEGDLEHALAASLSEALRDAWRYARLESAHIARPSNASAYLKGIALRPGAKIVYRTIVDGGWRDGWRGMLKIMLDASSDALVWTLVLLGATGNSSVEKNDMGRHFGRRPAGAPKVVALAGSRTASEEAKTWLAGLRAQGIDVALLSSEDSAKGLPSRFVAGLRPLPTMRALDVEMQVRTIHAVVPFGRRAKLVRRLLPGGLCPEIHGVDAGTEPAAAARRAKYADNVSL